MVVPVINNHSSINLIDLDFDGIKSSLLNYLRSNDQFKDYDFEASNINLLVELLAYNAHKNAFYQNMILNESFLDSAILRNSTLSRSKELNYLPRSYRSTKARVQIEFEATGENAPYVIEKGSPLTALVKSQAYTFTIPETITVASSNTNYTVETDIYEGVYIKDTYTFITANSVPRFKITNKNVDTSSLVVGVYEDGNEVADIYTYASSLLDLDSSLQLQTMSSMYLRSYHLLLLSVPLSRGALPSSLT